MRANFITGLKVCSVCRAEQPLENFHLDSNSRDQLCVRCKRCDRERSAKKYRRMKEDSAAFHKYLEVRRIKAKERYYKNPKKCHADSLEWRRKNPDKVRVLSRRSNYGLTLEETEAIRARQKNKCPGCHKDFTIVKDVIDHDHSTNRVRGLLCGNCNWCLGHAKDDPEILLRLAAYLQVAKSANS